MSVITLTTDFGIVDEYVGVMKGVILSVNPSASIVDITHHIPPQNIIYAAFLIQSSYRYFPKNTVHVIVVDPGVGTDRAILAARKDDHIFLAPDNGILTPILEDQTFQTLVSVDNSFYFLDSISHTFHGRDIFAPIAGHLAKGLPIEELGKKIDICQIKRISIPKPVITDQTIEGTIMMIDRFGNLITNIDKKILQTILNKSVRIYIGNKTIEGISENYSSVEFQKPLAIIGSKGYLEISINCGSAKNYFQAQMGDHVRIAGQMIHRKE